MEPRGTVGGRKDVGDREEEDGLGNRTSETLPPLGDVVPEDEQEHDFVVDP